MQLDSLKELYHQQAFFLHALGTGGRFDFGRMVVYTTLQFAEGGCKASSLLFPSLIYRLLKSQGFDKDSNEKLTVLGDAIKIVPALFKGHRKVDLLWVAPGTIPDVVPNVANIFYPTDCLEFHPSFLVDQTQ